MKKTFKLLAVSLFTFIASIISVNAAAKEPELVTIGGREILLANGTPITIEERTDGVEGALVKYGDGKEIKVTKEVGIFGGMHNSTEKVDTSITMNGGVVRNIIGGGLHESYVGTATININGGKVRMAIYGGGYDGYVSDADYIALGLKATDAENSKVKVDEAIINLNGGDLDTVGVYGGGGGYSYTGITTITTGNFEGKLDWLIAGGSNGYTKDAIVNFENGSAVQISGVNRGSMENISINVSGGTVEKVFAGVDPTDLTGDAGIAKNAEINITGGEVGTVSAGQMGGIDGSNSTNGNSSDKATVSLMYNKDTVAKVEDDFKEDTVIKTVTLTFKALDEEESIEIPFGFKFEEKDVKELENELEEVLVGSGYELTGLYKDEKLTTKYDFTKPFEENTIIYLGIAEVKTELPAKTGDINLIMLIGGIALAIGGIIVSSKKRLTNNI